MVLNPDKHQGRPEQVRRMGDDVAIEKRLAELRRFLADAPDFAELQQNGNAHLNALHLQQTLARLRAEGDTGRAAIAEFCSQLLKIILADTGLVNKAAHMSALYSTFTAAERENASKPHAEGAASTDFSSICLSSISPFFVLMELDT
ncbi:hypothetical protein C8R47DRAFT_1063864 [Mycena vitilis]|nr:hypothetical protein C8R47DRAFT_1063864 [Mycena vitilis]